MGSLVADPGPPQDDRKSLRRLGYHPLPKKRPRDPLSFSAGLVADTRTAGENRRQAPLGKRPCLWSGVPASRNGEFLAITYININIINVVVILVVAGYVVVNVLMPRNFFGGCEIFAKYQETSTAVEALRVAQKAYFAKTNFPRCFSAKGYRGIRPVLCVNSLWEDFVMELDGKRVVII